MVAEYADVDTLQVAILHLVKRIESLLERQGSDPRQRVLVALAGVPGSGKSTVSNVLSVELATRGVQDVAVVPMDGFHYTKQVLSTFADADAAFRRRGAPFTFDVEAFLKLITNLRTTPVTTPQEPETFILAPSFDHATGDPVEGAISISSHSRLVIIEGNYTLLNQQPWSQIAESCVEKWFVDTPVQIVRDRLAKRHLTAGIENTMQAAMKRAEENDIPNGDTIRSMLIQPDVTIRN